MTRLEISDHSKKVQTIVPLDYDYDMKFRSKGNLLRHFYYQRKLSGHHFLSYSSYGEDAIVEGVFKRLHWMGFNNISFPKTYLDIGCYHPIKDSNTFFLYQKGWKGTVVDPNIFFEPLFRKYRPKDNFFGNAVSNSSISLPYYVFGETASSNTMDKEFAEKIAYEQNLELPTPRYTSTISLENLIDSHLKSFGEYPFIVNIDVEGMDEEIVDSFQPIWDIPFILVEDVSLGTFFDSDLKKKLRLKGYEPIAANFLTTLYLRRNTEYYGNLIYSQP